VDDAPLPSPGQVLNAKYEVIRAIGGGGMGMVYEAHHKALARRVAIKVLQPAIGQSAIEAARFQREARAVAALRSPHAIRIFDVDTTAEGLVFMVMELLEGHDLSKELAAEENVPLPDLVDWMIQTCGALEEAHALRIVHRDLKPANIFLTRDATTRVRHAKVLDFGISKFLDHSSHPGLTTEPHTLLGTISYMSPEQLRGRSVDHRTDIWALGMLLYRALARRAPFNTKNEREYMAAVIADPPVQFEVVRPDLPSELANVIMKALEKSPEHRHASAAELARELAPFGSGHATVPRRAANIAADTQRDAKEPDPNETRRVASPDDDAFAETQIDRHPPRFSANDANDTVASETGGSEAVVVSPVVRKQPQPRTGLLVAAAIALLGVAASVIIVVTHRAPIAPVVAPPAAVSSPSPSPESPASEIAAPALPPSASASSPPVPPVPPVPPAAAAPTTRPRVQPKTSAPAQTPAPTPSPSPPTPSPSASNWLPRVL
jgi:eukaryotic-like serine/threonine-protein kinase